MKTGSIGSAPYLRGLSLALSSSLLLACGGGEVALEDAPAETASFICKTIRDCSGRLGPLRIDPTCEETFEHTLVNTSFDQIERVIAGGTASYDPVMMGQCLSETKALGCDLRVPQPRSCREAYIGTIALGGACAVDSECEGDRECTAEGSTCGVCQERAGAGESCIGDNNCALGLMCQNQVCGSELLPGCEGETGGDCRLDELCVGGDDTTVGECIPIVERMTASLDEACDRSTDIHCRAGLSCVPTDPLSEGGFACKPIATEGGACRSGSPSQCPVEQYCALMADSIDGTCQRLPGDGQPCASRSVSGRCGSGLQCALVDDELTCLQPQDNGGACTVDAQCYSRRCEGGLCVGPELCAP